MRPEELMCGDLISMGGVVRVVTGVHVKETENGVDLITTMIPGFTFPESNLSFRAFYANPIPLTPEILEKNGWYKSHYGYGRDCMRLDGNEDELPDGADNALASALWSIDKDYQYHHLEFFMWKGHTMTTVHYVHELQHVFRLHGVEKEIVL